MSINAISSVSLYEYYYTINQETRKKNNSLLAKQMREYGLTPTDNDTLNAAMLNRAQSVEENQEEETDTSSYADRPWADIMYQLNLTFNEDPKDDIQDIKDEIRMLAKGIDDDELNKEITDLEDYAERLYINFQNNSIQPMTVTTLTNELNNLSLLNQASLL